MSDDLKHRLGGIALLCIAAAVCWYFVLAPLQAAEAGAANVRYSLKAFVLVPFCAVFGAAWLVSGARLDYRDAEHQRLKPLGWALFAVVVTLCAVGFWWFKSRFSALGYQ